MSLVSGPFRSPAWLSDSSCSAVLDGLERGKLRIAASIIASFSGGGSELGLSTSSSYEREPSL